MNKFTDQNLTFDERALALLEELTLEEKLLLLTSHQNAIPRLGIKETYIGAEVARGLVCRGPFGEAPTTVFPEPIGLAATFDPDIMRKMGEITGNETRIYHADGKSSLFVWGPTVDAGRDPRWGRTEECYGEDVFLIGEMSAAYTIGMAGEDAKYLRVVPTLKHFYANNNEEDRGRDNASIPICLKHDYYLKAFETAIKHGGARSVMTSYNEINGVEGLCNPELDTICKKQWGMLFSVTDGGDLMQNVLLHHSDNTHTEAVARVYRSHGADIMTDDEEIVRASAKEALDKGLLSEKDIDNALFGVIKARLMTGEFDSACPYSEPQRDALCSESSYKVSEKAAEESVILLRNSKGVLPLEKRRTAIIGVHADMNFRDWYTGVSEKKTTILDAVTAHIGRENVVYESGNDIIALRNAENDFYFALGEDGTLRSDCSVLTEDCLLELFEWGEDVVSFRSKKNGKFLSDVGVMKCTSDEVYGWFVKEQFKMERSGSGCVLRNWQGRYLYITKKGEIAVSTSQKPPAGAYFNIEVFSSGLDRVKRAAMDAQNVVVFAGNHPLINARECYDRRHLDIPERQRSLLDTALTVNADTVLFLVSGYTYAVDERVDSVLHISHAGPAMGDAVAKVLFGAVSPSGRCPVTWYKSADELCDIKDYNIIRTRSTYLYYDGEPLFPFGHGLSYTAFRYSAAASDKKLYQKGERVEVTVEIKNTGQITSDEVAQLYVKPPRFSSASPQKKLMAFKRVSVPKGELVRVVLSFDVDALAVWDISKNDFEVYSGFYEIEVGTSGTDIRRTLEIEIAAENYTGLDVSKEVPAAASWDYTEVEFKTDKALREYALIKDWQSRISYENCVMRGHKRVELVVSNPGSRTRLTIGSPTAGEIVTTEIPPTGGFDRFVKVTANVRPVEGMHTLDITTGGVLSLKSFKFLD